MNRKSDGRYMALSFLAVVGLLVTGIALPSQATEVTEANSADKVAEATTQADHEALAAYFRGEAEANAKKVAEHEAMMKRMAARGGKPSARWQAHCESLIAAYGSAQKEAQGLAEDHERMAKEAAQ